MPTAEPASAALPAVLFDVVVAGLSETVGPLPLHSVVDLSRSLDREVVVRAVDELVDDFPLLRSRLVSRFWRSRWEPIREVTAADVVTVTPPAADPDEALRAVARRGSWSPSQWPLRVTLIPTALGTRLVVSTPHLVADGAGALTVFRELAVRIAGSGGARRAADRGFSQLLGALRPAQLPTLLWGLALEYCRPLGLPLLARTPMALAQERPVEVRPVFRTVRARFEEGSPLRAMCRRVGCTINDALVAALARLNAALSSRGRLGNYFTIDLRRYLTDDGARVTNLSGVESIILARGQAATLEGAARAVRRRTERLKRRLVGVPFALGPLVYLFWVPQGVLRWASALGGRWLLSLMDRGLLVTNIGPMDDAAAPFGDDARAAFVLGPFVRGARIPAITATGFRGEVTLQINAFDDIAAEALDRVAEELERILVDEAGG